ncbi:MAG: aminomethyl-transferring glycine dehydrogenase [Flavobacteriales bacterium]
MSTESFYYRHTGSEGEALEQMLEKINCKSLDELIDKTIPSSIRLKNDLNLPERLCEYDYLNLMEYRASQNQVFKAYIGMGYYPTVVPSVIRRNVLENPGWYTAYTPYQAEIAQGRLEALLNFQTMVCDLTGMELANASLLDESTAAGEAMTMFFNLRSRAQAKFGVNKFYVQETTFKQTKDVIITRAKGLGIEVVFGNGNKEDIDETFFGMLLQYPDANGAVDDYSGLVAHAHEKGVKVAVAADLMSLVLLTPPGEWGADAVIGNSQRFGVPMGYGGPHAAFFATREAFKRSIPGRIIGVSKDRLGNTAYRMALQTREQHIKRDKATSNICTAQALLAVMSSMYTVYHGPTGLRKISSEIHNQARALAAAFEELGYKNVNERFFDTLKIYVGSDFDDIKMAALARKVNLRYFQDQEHVGISLNETVNQEDIIELVSIFLNKQDFPAVANHGKDVSDDVLGGFLRSSQILQHEVFNRYHSETEMMRYVKRLENKDLSLVHSMIPLGSCTMKLNAASELIPITWTAYAGIHPFAPSEQVKGYRRILEELSKDLCEITGFDSVSLQPNSGAQGEYTGLMTIKSYHESRGDHHRNICLIPSSAHGTNPASAVMAGMKVVVVKCDEDGNIDFDDMKAKAEQHSENLAACMITYPSTHGVFEEGVISMTSVIHENGGQVYMDGANMNAQVGLTSPGNIGADVCHLNLHKTFAIPHGGGGPGMGPIGVAKHLTPHLPQHYFENDNQDEEYYSVSSAPFGSALILLISYGYIKMLGSRGLTDSTKMAILNANYIQARLEGYYDVLYKGKSGTVAHEMIIDCREFAKTAGVEVTDIAKRLIDYGFHAPTVSFPVNGTMMIEPTESESKAELDKFCDAMILIRKEIDSIVSGEFDRQDNPLKMSPHIALEVSADEWNHKYSRKLAAYPAEYLNLNKFWTSVARVDNAFGDRNLICTCPSIEEYALEEA